MNQDYENEVQENFEVGTVCSALKYKVNVFGMEMNIWVLLLVVAVVAGALFYQRVGRMPQLSDLSFSSTSSMGDIHKQMGGFTLSTPSFIRNL